MSLATEARFVSEQQLHDAVAEFPELIPHDRFGLGRLTVLAREFPCAAGYIDLLLVDEFGRLVVCEVKKGAENADVRRVIAQMLDYGAALWQTDIDASKRPSHTASRARARLSRDRSPRSSGRSRSPRRSGSKLLSAWPTAISCSSTSYVTWTRAPNASWTT
jgi:hypothetical protein